MEQLTIAFMVKAPRPGLVKTRLGRTLGNERACAVYRWMAERQSAAFPEDWPVVVYFAPADAGEEMRAWLGSRFDYRPQVEGDLGARMLAATQEAFAGGCGGVVLVGADCPGLGRDDLEAVARHLHAEADVVFGPATDGGYYLLGVSRFIPELFSDIPWSGPDTLALSLQRSKTMGLRMVLLERKEDVDDAASLRHAVDAGLISRSVVDGGRGNARAT